MGDYQPNSHKFKAEQKEAASEKKFDKVISGTAKIGKKSEVRKFADVFISEDAAKVKDHLVNNMLIPGLKRLTVSMIKTGAEIVFGEKGIEADRDSRSSKLPYISYNRFSGRDDDYIPRESVRPRGGFDYNDIILENKGDVVRLLDIMNSALKQYGQVSIGDLYDMLQITDHNFMNHKYGWYNLDTAGSVRLADGRYRLKLPRAVSLD